MSNNSVALGPTKLDLVGSGEHVAGYRQLEDDEHGEHHENSSDGGEDDKKKIELDINDSISTPSYKNVTGTEWKYVFLAALTTALSMSAAAIYNPLLPDIESSLGVTSKKLMFYSSIIFQYPYGMFPLVWGPLADGYGRRPVLLISLSIMTAGLILSSVSFSLPVLFIARFITGIGAAAPQTVVQGVLGDVIKEPTLRARLVGLYAFVAVIAMAFCPVIGGVLSTSGQNSGWRYVFVFLACLTFVSIIVLFIFLKETLKTPEGQESVSIWQKSLKGYRGFGSFIKQTHGFVFVVIFMNAVMWGSVNTLQLNLIYPLRYIFHMNSVGIGWVTCAMTVGLAFGFLFGGMISDQILKRAKRGVSKSGHKVPKGQGNDKKTKKVLVSKSKKSKVNTEAIRMSSPAVLSTANNVAVENTLLHNNIKDTQPAHLEATKEKPSMDVYLADYRLAIVLICLLGYLPIMILFSVLMPRLGFYFSSAGLIILNAALGLVYGIGRPGFITYIVEKAKAVSPDLESAGTANGILNMVMFTFTAIEGTIFIEIGSATSEAENGRRFLIAMSVFLGLVLLCGVSVSYRILRTRQAMKRTEQDVSCSS